MTSTCKRLVIRNLESLVTLDDLWISADNLLGVIEQGAIVIQDGQIVWVGLSSDLPVELPCDATIIEGQAKMLTPGLIDCHTHTIFAGNRADEFEARLSGKTYQEITCEGGGILKTVEATRQASVEELSALTKARLDRMLAYGVTTVEIKSGYGLTTASELKCLQVLNQLKASHPISIVATFMGGHDIPPEYKHNPDAYVDLICQEMIPLVAQSQLADFCDVFCETGYFSVAQSRQILETARQLGLKLKIHAEEFNDIGGAVLAGELQASSAEHLLNVSESGISALKQGGTVAVLLPGTAFYLRLPYAPAQQLLEAGVPVALATDFNPGSCMTENLQLIMSLGCIQMGMTPVQVLQAVTVHAARALNLEADRGSLTVGKRADLVLWDCPNYQTLFYHFGINWVNQVFVAGKAV